MAHGSRSIDVLRARLRKERRTNKRLRVIIDELGGEVRSIRSDLDVQFHRIAQLQVELDETKKAIPGRLR